MNADIMAALLKRAVGYSCEEVSEEYSISDGEEVLVKRKVTRKDVPPDITAIKMLLEGDETASLTDEQLEREKQRLLKLLAQSEFVKSEKASKKKKSEKDG